jgi:AhpD family alkylhydroperoxidase
VFLRDGRLMLTVLGGLAELERELIRIRTSEPNSCAPGCVNTHSLVLIAIALG